MQPLTQLFTKVKPANDIARADLDATRANAKQTENEIALKVHQIYYSVLIAQLHLSASEARIKATEALKNERVQQVKYGSALDQETDRKHCSVSAGKAGIADDRIAAVELDHAARRRGRAASYDSPRA